MDEKNPLNHRINQEEADKLLAQAVHVIGTGSTVLTTKNGDRQLAAYVEISPDTIFGQDIIERWGKSQSDEEFKTSDNVSRWTMIDSGRCATILFETIDAEDPDDEDALRGVIAFDYPRDRDALMIAGFTGWITLNATKDPVASGGSLLDDKIESSKKSLYVIEISTGDQITEMIRIMDKRNPDLRKRTVKEIISKLDIGMKGNSLPFYGLTDKDTIIELLRRESEPLKSAIGFFQMFAVEAALKRDLPQTAGEIAKLTDMDAESVEKILHMLGSQDNSRVWGRSNDDGEMQWITDVEGGTIKYPGGRSIMKSPERVRLARELLEEANIPIPIHELSPALSMMTEILDISRHEGMLHSILNKKAPTWALAKGFSKTYEQCMTYARNSKSMGLSNTDGITRLNIQIGHSLQICHVLTMTSEQFMMLPDLQDEAESFMKTTSLPFDPFFIDFTADDHLPVIMNDDNNFPIVNLIGALVNTAPDDQIVFITPIFYYQTPNRPLEAVALGSIAINKSGVKNIKFEGVIGSESRFFNDEDMCVVVAGSKTLETVEGQTLKKIYRGLIWTASLKVISALYLIEAANVEIVPRELERRDKKRQEKRGWFIPLTIRVQRPSRRSSENGNGNGGHVEFSHQFEVIGHFKHVTRGHAVSCVVCGGKETEDLPCPRCNGTGLDPEKVSECTRIDIKTGEKTCPLGCRKIWTPPFVKGPTDKPLVIKTRRIT